MPSSIDIGLLILRLVLGLVFIAHGSQKLFGWFGGGGIAGQVRLANNLGMRPPLFWALVSASGEFFGGLGILVGLLTPIAAIGIIGSMLVAIIKVHWSKGFWNAKGGIEWPIMLATVAFVLGLTGPGVLSLDYLLGINLPEPITYAALLAAMVVGVIAALTISSLRPATGAPAGPGRRPERRPERPERRRR
ncbi:MAG: DoxX family protein [Chloroflexi bacterium]|nr:DoxX family protein [Chloroflexota bacterium]